MTSNELLSIIIEEELHEFALMQIYRKYYEKDSIPLAVQGGTLASLIFAN